MNRAFVLEKFAGRCAYCGRKLTSTTGWHVDHVHPKHRGGTDDDSNLMPACARCNRWKATFTVDEFRAEIDAQIGRLARDSAGFRLMHDFGLIKFTNVPTLFHFERVTRGCEDAGCECSMAKATGVRCYPQCEPIPPSTPKPPGQSEEAV